jgi:hypothetical protein
LKERLEAGWNYDDEDPNDKLVMEAIRIVLGTQTKVDDTRLRRRQTDMLPQLLRMLKEEEAKLPPLIDLPVLQSEPAE